jgi:hypothetical protein
MKLKYIKEDLRFVKALFSPFKPFGLSFYFGKVAIGTPYFLPRKWVKNKDKPWYLKAIPRKFGFDFVRLGWKTKWSEKDFRFEWAPMISFVCFNRQFVISVRAPHQHHYWEAWLYYEYCTDHRLPKWLRLRHCRENFPITWTVYHKSKETWETDREETIDYYTKIIKPKYLV